MTRRADLTPAREIFPAKYCHVIDLEAYTSVWVEDVHREFLHALGGGAVHTDDKRVSKFARAADLHCIGWHPPAFAAG